MHIILIYIQDDGVTTVSKDCFIEGSHSDNNMNHQGEGTPLIPVMTSKGLFLKKDESFAFGLLPKLCKLVPGF